MQLGRLARRDDLGQRQACRRVNLLCRPFARARRRPIRTGRRCGGERGRRFLFREFRIRLVLELEPALVRSAAMVTAPVELRRGTGTSPTRWPQPQHGKGALELARATLPLGKGAALTCSVALSRARGADRSAPAAAAAASAVADSFFANSGSGWSRRGRRRW